MESRRIRKPLLLALFTLTLGSAVLAPAKTLADFVYVPVSPCRLADTRVAGGAITANTFRNFKASGTAGELAVQGSNSDCLAPRAETGLQPVAISAYIIAVPAASSSGPGVLTAYPSDQLPPSVGAGSTVNFAAAQTIGNTTNITLCNSNVTNCPLDGEFAVLARSTDEHAVIDVQGYFYEPQQQMNEGHVSGTTGAPVPGFNSSGNWTSAKVGVGVYRINVTDLLVPTSTGCGPKSRLPNPVVSVWNTGAVTTAAAFVNGVGANCGTLTWTFFVKTVIDGVAADSDFTFQFTVQRLPPQGP